MSTAAGGIKKKRNFKSLNLPAGGASDGSFAAGSSESTASYGVDDSSGGDGGDVLPLNRLSLEDPSTSVASAIANLPPRANRQQSRQNLELGLEFCVDLRAEDLTELDELGSGNGGVVVKALHIPTNIIMAKKSIKLDIKPESRKRIIRELQFLHECNSPHVVSFYGAFLSGRGDVCMCMEFMDVGSFDDIYRKNGPIPIDIIGKALVAVLNGLIYIYETHRIIHRDIKPSNILLNSQGQVKLIDFGVSGELVDSIAKTFVGTGSYMSPERIQGAPYSVKSDVWSLGITLMELALGRYPLSPDGNPLPVFDLMQAVVNEDPPKLPEGQFPADFDEFVARCLVKNPADRPNFVWLRTNSTFVQKYTNERVDVAKWAAQLKK